jgi:hypothetical protein
MEKVVKKMIPFDVSTCSIGSRAVRVHATGSIVPFWVEDSHLNIPDDCSTITVKIAWLKTVN